ncbi:MAG: hypothetical protein IKB07_03935 [Lachnospiraceae bacterium]|nr:hypothetical protein [Lachnospiraceae bacterium]
MKQIILSADGECGLYLVPDEVVDNLPKYIGDFRDWMVYAPEASKYRRDDCLCFNKTDFIDYLNNQVFLETPSVFLKNLGFINPWEEVPEEYKGCIHYNF